MLPVVNEPEWQWIIIFTPMKLNISSHKLAG